MISVWQYVSYVSYTDTVRLFTQEQELYSSTLSMFIP